MKNFHASYSSMNVASSCWRKLELDKFYPKRSRAQEDWYAADVGSALHAGFQSYLIDENREQAEWKFMRAFPFVEEWSQPNDYRSFDAAFATLHEMMDSMQMGEYALAKIRRPWSPKEIADSKELGVDLTLVESPIVPAIEVPFEIRFKGMELSDGRGISFIGYIDAIMQKHATGVFRTLDIKTSRMHLSDATGKYMFNSQQVPYGIVVDHVAQGIVDSFEVLYLDCYIDLLEPKVALYPFTKYREDVNEWALNKVIQFEQLIRFERDGYFPRTDGGCLFFNKPCRYLDICHERDRESLESWFLMGEEPASDREEFHPWIIADIEIK